MREDAGDGGLRVRRIAGIANALCVVQVDTGFGDAMPSGPRDAVYPVLLGDLQAPHLLI